MSLELREDVAALIKQAGGPRGGGDYVSHLVTARYRLWRDSYLALRAAGWTAPQILTACDAFNGFLLVGAPTADVLRMELEDHAHFSNAIERFGLDADVWRERLTSLDADTAYSLWAVTNEILAGNRELKDQLTDGT